MTRLTLVVVVALTVWTEGPARAADPDLAARRDRLAAELEDLRAALKIPGLSAAVVKDGQVVWAAGLGFADLEARAPATEHTTYRIASLTKTFASTLVLRLVEQGKLDLDAPMSKFSPNFKDIQASEELLNRVREVSHAVDARIQQVLARQGENPESDPSAALDGD